MDASIGGIKYEDLSDYLTVTDCEQTGMQLQEEWGNRQYKPADKLYNQDIHIGI